MSSAGDDALETNLTDSVTTAQLGQPTLTVILPTIGNYQRIKKTLAHLQAQTARSEIEVLIVASSEEALRLDPAAAEGFLRSTGHRGWRVPVPRCGEIPGSGRGQDRLGGLR